MLGREVIVRTKLSLSSNVLSSLIEIVNDYRTVSCSSSEKDIM